MVRVGINVRVILLNQSLLIIMIRISAGVMVIGVSALYLHLD